VGWAGVPAIEDVRVEEDRAIGIDRATPEDENDGGSSCLPELNTP
jgi:hypothetical protein